MLRAVEARKKQHAELNAFLTERGGHITSVPGNPVIRVEVPIGSSLPATLRSLGHKLSEVGTTMRIDPLGHQALIHTTVGATVCHNAAIRHYDVWDLVPVTVSSS